ncbi:ferritin-like domain-containing protein [Halorussus sp. MSC15.2]|uniref:ferritin-like domain-containing protein n=1 Tax=Halorussus sp. MSC15.2 TaxID=2283638 RepID=UPI0013D14DA8|nr:ferritin-like domain-containing protein [Halorussus sp. MSC15.2]NEU56305.1 ferritin-like domain-containing protein [Halorussus sp. MSC15.2]
MTENNRDDERPEESIEALTENLGGGSDSRRGFLKKGATASAAGLGLSAGAGNVAASGDGDETTTQAEGQDEVNPVAVLNYALVLERLEATFYTRGLEEFSEDEIESSDIAGNFGETVQSSLYDQLTTIRDHEQSHVDYLVKTIEKLGGDPVSADQVSFAFPLESPSGFIKTGQTLETTGVSAYDGAINLLKQDNLLTAAATVATVEGRHSAYLNGLTGKSPFPRAFDNAKPPAEILPLVAPFVEGDVKELLEIV